MENPGLILRRRVKINGIKKQANRNRSNTAAHWDRLAQRLGYPSHGVALWLMYWRDIMPMSEIAPYFNTCAANIAYRLKINGIPARPRGGDNRRKNDQL